VWGRGSLGGGGFGDFKALDVVKATTPAQSVALFGQGWTWEKTQELEGKAWTARGWWEYDRKLWVGTRRPGELTGSVSTPTELKDAVRLYPLLYGNGTKLSEADQIAIKPIQSYFPTRAPTDPVYIPFSTTFCPGVGYSWFAEGKKLMHLTEGWCDVDKQTSLGNLVWPGDDPDKPLAEISFEDAWSGGSSLLLSSKTSSMANWRSVPITDLTVSLDLAYSISIVWKVTSSTRNISVQPTVDSPSFSIITTDRGTKDVGSGWSRSTLDFTISSTPVPVPAPSDKPVAKVTLGLWAFATRDKALYPLTSAQETIAASPLSLLVGQVVVTPIDPNETIPDIVNTEWVPSNTAPVAGTLNGVLRWTIDYAFAATASQSSSSLIPWSFNQITDRLPSFAYFNIYISLESDLESKIFVGTTGVDGQGSEFFFRGIQVADISSKLSSPCVIHLLVQGVTDKGQATPLTGGVIVHIT
jgi:mannosyl-glycoprotein endo-beta-N-acetylglucosaminidase